MLGAWGLGSKLPCAVLILVRVCVCVEYRRRYHTRSKSLPGQTTSTVPAPYLPKPKVYPWPLGIIRPISSQPYHTVLAGIKPIPTLNFSPLQCLSTLTMRDTSFYSRHTRPTSDTVTIVQKFSYYDTMPARQSQISPCHRRSYPFPRGQYHTALLPPNLSLHFTYPSPSHI